MPDPPFHNDLFKHKNGRLIISFYPSSQAQVLLLVSGHVAMVTSQSRGYTSLQARSLALSMRATCVDERESVPFR